jgi:CGNR zinc finger
MRRWRSPEGLLLPVGEALAKFVCEEDFSNVKAGEGPACTLMFADHTRGRARRWCSMAICGNRAPNRRLIDLGSRCSNNAGVPGRLRLSGQTGPLTGRAGFCQLQVLPACGVADGEYRE